MFRSFEYLAAFSNAGGSKLSYLRVLLKTTPNFALFDPLVRIRGGVGGSSIQIVEALPTTEAPKYFSWPSTAIARLLSAVY